MHAQNPPLLFSRSRLSVRQAAICAAAAFATLLPGRARAAGDLAESLRDGSLFRTPIRQNPVFLGESFAWIVQNSQLRFVKPGFTLGAVHPGETIVELDAENGAPSRLRVSVYNRGDDGPLGDTSAAATAAFAAKLRETGAAMDTLAGAKGTVYRRKTDPTKTAADIAGCRWTVGEAAVWLEWALGRDQRTALPEYLRAEIAPAAAAAAQPAKPASLSPVVLRREMPKRVRREPDGTVILDVPMVDQGQKGYCAAASVARVMAYYGFDFLDQHQIASWAESDADRGTSDAMLKKISGVLHDRYKLVYNELPAGKCDLQELVKKYNREAKRQKRPEAVYGPAAGTRIIMASDIWNQFEPDLLRAARTSNAQANQLFFDAVRKSINAGVPLVWSVMLGYVPEDPPIPQARGGHMRLIIGYTADKRILYSDSWGAGHERKSMALEDAIAITTGLRSIAWTLN